MQSQLITKNNDHDNLYFSLVLRQLTQKEKKASTNKFSIIHKIGLSIFLQILGT